MNTTVLRGRMAQAAALVSASMALLAAAPAVQAHGSPSRAPWACPSEAVSAHAQAWWYRLLYGRCPEETREHDSRAYVVDEGKLPFDALAGSSTETDRWWGVLEGAGYRIEVPKNWNGILVMYAHGYAGTGPALAVSNPSIRRHLIEQGYAWAASSYSKNHYDVRAGVEDTNALALAFNRIAKANGRPLAKPRKTYITGHSMGGHVTGAAIELETLLTANHKVFYDGAVPMCGVMGSTRLFDYLLTTQILAQEIAGYSAHTYPLTSWPSIGAQVRGELFTTFSTVPTPVKGVLQREAIKQISGGERPIYYQGYGNTALQNVVWGTFGGDGTINGILNKPLVNTAKAVYQFDNDPALSPQEQAFNDSVYRYTEGTPAANRLRRDGMRWIPEVNGQFFVPVVSLHTLGDLYVPFNMQQIYRQRAQAQGSGRLLVQRAIRAPSHCDFTVAEQVAAFDAMVQWEQRGVKPAGDDVLTPATVAQPAYGCTYTVNTGGVDDNPITVATRTLMPACPASP